MIPRIAKLPVSSRGYPVPFFVQWINGEPDFRVMDRDKWLLCVTQKLCWVCGEKLGVNKAFIAGPMCAINRTSAEPPAHKDCGEWTIQACPFLVRPKMTRREDELSRAAQENVAGTSITRNPGAAMVWVTNKYKVFDDGYGKPLIEIGEPLSVSWWAEGKPATYAQVNESISTGLPLLEKMCAGQEDDLAELARRREALEPWLPKV